MRRTIIRTMIEFFPLITFSNAEMFYISQKPIQFSPLVLCVLFFDPTVFFCFLLCVRCTVVSKAVEVR